MSHDKTWMMADGNNASPILLTGGSGLLGRELRKLLPDAYCPSSWGFDVTDFDSMRSFAKDIPEGKATLVHTAAYTFTQREKMDPLRAMEVNIIGTANVVKLCLLKKWRLLYMSTDYVFKGDRGGYGENDPVQPFNSYAWSKLGGECAVQLYDRSLIVRATFGPKPFPFDKAFNDQWTSKLDVSALALALVRLIQSDLVGVIHVGSDRRSIAEYARSVSPGKHIEEISVKSSPVAYPHDTSLDCGKFRALFGTPDGIGGESI